MNQFEKDEKYVGTDEVTIDEIKSRIEACVFLMLKDIINTDSHQFSMIDRSEKNVMEEDDSSLIRLGNVRKKRKISHKRSLLSYSRTWKVMSVIYKLLINGKHMTQRELFYLLVYCFNSQATLNEIILDVVSLLHVPREFLGIYSSSRGYIGGRYFWNDGNGFLDCSNMGIPGMAIPGYFPHNLCIMSKPGNVRYIIVVEKEGVFQRLLEDKFHFKIPCIMLTAKGFPDLSTRMIIHYLKRKFKVPVLGLVDYNPYGVLILMNYKIGSIRFGLEAFKYAVPEIKWIGLHKKDTVDLNLLKTPLSERDKSIKKRLLRMKFVKENSFYLEEIQKMEYKVEIQTMNRIGFDFLSNTYLRNKILRKDFF